MKEIEDESILVNSLPESGPRRLRIDQLIKHFRKVYEHCPEFIVRVPGRVNLIGEHIDYCGYSVCPMAIDQDILLAVKVTKSIKLKLTNTDPTHKNFECEIINIRINHNGAPKWSDYFLCGVKAILNNHSLKLPVGMKVAVCGNIPLNSGLSSSSALVSAAAVATAFANNRNITKTDLALICASAEQYVGTEGGGMDQAIAILASKGCAKHIQFNPLRASDVKLPENATFVIVHSLQELNKAATSDYNCRVVECRLASQILGKLSGIEHWRLHRRLIDVQETLGIKDLQEMADLVTKHLHPEPYTKQELCDLLQVKENELNELDLSPDTRDINEFKLQQRALHVFLEANRVLRFISICQESQAGGDIDYKDSLKRLGDLMNESHQSCRNLYECSHEALDRVVELSSETTYGVRLTGAGWGGCTVALCDTSSADLHVATIKKKYFDNHPKATGRDIETLVFKTEPCEGACIYLFKNLNMFQIYLS